GGLFAVAVALFALTPYKGITPEKLPREAAAKEKKKEGKMFGGLVLLFAMAIGMYAAMENSQTFFIKPYFLEELSDPAHSGICISIIWLSMIPSRLLAARMHHNKARLVIICFLVASLCGLGLALTRSSTLALILCGLFGLAAGPAFTTIMSMSIDACPGHAGKASALLLCGGSVFGSVASISMGVVSDAIGVGSGFFIVAGFALLGAVVVYFAQKKAQKEKRLA
ncbi:MAG: MFS transporter, partial [Christensenellaceae bacterium]|nr:MFS transporter [Christensenellaceae bacterium]